MNAEPLVVCPKCSKPALKRGLGGGAGMIFKGSGFYLTDYKKSDGKKPDTSTSEKSANAKSEKPKETTTSESGSDSKQTKGEKE
jgi:predicted nucleic acid-binding Zn ribbon protein